MEMVGHLGSELDLDGKELSQKLFAVDDPVTSVCVVFSGLTIVTTETVTADAAGPAVKEGLAFSAQELAARIGNHEGIPPVVPSFDPPGSELHARRNDLGIKARAFPSLDCTCTYYAVHEIRPEAPTGFTFEQACSRQQLSDTMPAH